ncbi:MAG: helix-turn-helix domain-containing protein [Alphaproteobacteria bacterium]|nr:MAG: helix-turn-helix domain-containing protein [Alphaproteobacteria bacterium]
MGGAAAQEGHCRCLYSSCEQGREAARQSQEGGCDGCGLQLKRPDDFIAGEDDTRILVSYTKSRHLQAKDTQDMEATLRIEDDALQWSHTNGNPHYLRCIELVKEGIPFAEIADELSVSKSTVSRWKKRAVSEGLI